MGDFTERPAHPPGVVSTHVHTVILVRLCYSTAHRVEVKPALRLLEQEREVVEVQPVVEILVFAELGGFLITANTDAAELDRAAIQHPARRLRRLLHEWCGGNEQSSRRAGIHGDAQPLRITFDD